MMSYILRLDLRDGFFLNKNKKKKKKQKTGIIGNNSMKHPGLPSLSLFSHIVTPLLILHHSEERKRKIMYTVKNR